MIRAAAAAALALVLGGSAAPLRLAGCPVFPATDFWNCRVDSLPVARDSAAIVASIGGDEPLRADFGSGLWQGSPIGIPFTVVGKATPKVSVRSYPTGGFPPQARIVLRALKEYGMVVADNGADWYVAGAPVRRWSNDQLQTLRRVRGSAFEVVDTRRLR